MSLPSLVPVPGRAGSSDGYLYKLARAGGNINQVWRFSASDVIYSQPQIDSKGNICEFCSVVEHTLSGRGT